MGVVGVDQLSGGRKFGVQLSYDLMLTITGVDTRNVNMCASSIQGKRGVRYR